jgi:hypothetical protein
MYSDESHPEFGFAPECWNSDPESGASGLTQARKPATLKLHLMYVSKRTNRYLGRDPNPESRILSAEI